MSLILGAAPAFALPPAAVTEGYSYEVPSVPAPDPGPAGPEAPSAADKGHPVDLSSISGPTLEQVSVNMPDVTVYGYGLIEAGTGSADLGGRELKAGKAVPFLETGEGVDYYLLMDISNSIPNSYFKEIKEASVDLAQSIRPADRMTFITFGKTVELRGDISKDRTSAEEVMKEIRNADNRTLLFEAISKAADLATTQDDPLLKRKIFFVISDGEDVADGKAVAQEALNNLREKGISVYALCINDTARDHKNSFGEFARNSGGVMEIFKAGGCGSSMNSMKERILSADCLYFTASTNRVPHNYERFNLKLPGLEVPLTREVFLYRHQEDRTAPVIEAEGLGGRDIRVRFSEAVIGDGDPASYQLRSEETGELVPIGGVARDESGSLTTVISAADAFPKGRYTLSCPGVRDDSQEENPVSNSVTLDLEKSDEDIVVESESPKYAMAAALMALAAAILGIILALRRSKKKEEEKQREEGGSVPPEVVYTPPRPDPRFNGGTYVAMEAARDLPLVLTITTSDKKTKRIRKVLDKSLIVGRNNMCDLYFDDPRMSKQHFALEWNGHDLMIQDLQSTNGTYVNGVRLSSMKRRLEKGDRVSAGQESIEISW